MLVVKVDLFTKTVEQEISNLVLENETVLEIISMVHV